jgi:hypothetical protein
LSTPDSSARRAQLERRIREYHDTTIADVLEVISYLRDEDDCVIAGGSLGLGLGNRLSDLDVVVAGTRTVGSSRVPLEHFVKSLRVDVWKLDHRLIDGTFERAEQALAAEGSLQGGFGDVDHETDLKLLHRVAFGIRLDGPELPLASERDYGAIARDIVVREYAERLRESALLAQLAVELERPVAAAINARLAVEEALHATIAARGLSFSGDKWLNERLRHDAQDLESLYLPYSMLPERGADCAAFVAGALATAAHVTGLELSADAIRGEASWRNSDLRCFQVGRAHMLLSIKTGGIWELEGDEVAAWERMTGEHRDGDGDQSWPCDSLDPAEMRLCQLLFERGVMTLMWARGVPLAEFTAGGEVRA